MHAIPVVFLTALRTDRESRVKALETGAEGFLAKPLDEVELIAQIMAMAKIKAANRRKKLEKEQLAGLVAERTRELEKELAERRRAEAALLESEARYRRITEGLADYQYTVRVENGRALVTKHSPACRIVTGYSAEEFDADPYLWFRMIAPDDRQTVTDRIQQVLAGGDIPPLEHRIIRKDGELRWVSDNIICYRDTSGTLLAYDGVVKDITERKRVEEANQRLLQETQDRYREIAALALANSRTLESLENSEIRFRSLVETATDAIISIDGSRSITLWNHGAEKIFGYSADEAIGKDISLILPPSARDSHALALTRTFSCGQLQTAGISREVFGLKKDGTEVPVELTVSRWQTGEGVFFTSIIRDITERKQQEASRERLQAQLNQAQKMEAIGMLAGGIAHDFNNILGAILGYTEMARDDAPRGSQLASDLDKVLTAANRAKELVKQILGFSRQSTADRIPIKIQPLIKETIKMLRASIPSTIAITENIDPRCGVVLADSTQIHQIAMNLCSNAFQAMEETGGELAVTLKSVSIDGQAPGKKGHLDPGEYVELAVSDTGKGIGPDIIEKIFDPYFTTKETGKGTGMGLSIAHGIVQSYGGAITVESSLGRGTTFRVYFPVIQEEANTVESFQDVPRGKGRILFLDDEEVLARMGKVMLERLGYTVTVHTHSIEALADFLCNPEKFDLVITDQTMPVMTGIDLARRMLQIRPDLPIILCTGFSNLVDEESAKVMGIKAFALKPLTKAAIGRLTGEVLKDAGKNEPEIGHSAPLS